MRKFLSIVLCIVMALSMNVMAFANIDSGHCDTCGETLVECRNCKFTYPTYCPICDYCLMCSDEDGDVICCDYCESCGGDSFIECPDCGNMTFCTVCSECCICSAGEIIYGEYCEHCCGTNFNQCPDCGNCTLCVVCNECCICAEGSAGVAEESNYSTNVSYEGAGEEVYTVSVPAFLAPGGSGNVTVSGTWPYNKKVTVSAAPDVVLTNSILSSDTKTLKVSFAGINKTGNNTKDITANDDGCTVAVSVANIENALFGTWEGTFNYNVGISDAGSEEETLVAGAYFGEAFLTWEELKESGNGETYGYDASAISDTSIGDYAFSECAGITSINLPDGLTSIGDGAFKTVSLTAAIYKGTTYTSISELESVLASAGVTLGEDMFMYSDLSA